MPVRLGAEGRVPHLVKERLLEDVAVREDRSPDAELTVLLHEPGKSSSVKTSRSMTTSSFAVKSLIRNSGRTISWRSWLKQVFTTIRET